MERTLKTIILASAITLLTPSCAPFISSEYITFQHCLPEEDATPKIEKMYDAKSDSIETEKEKQINNYLKRIGGYSNPIMINFMNFD